jgi:hypothetical protein
MKIILKSALTISIALSGVVPAQVAIGDGFTLDQSVIAGGGGTSSGGEFEITGTSGQAAAGVRPITPGFRLHNGFWNSTQLGPTAGDVRISGQVRTTAGTPVSNVQVTMTTATGISQTAITNAFGYYRFDEVEAGQTVFLTVRSKRFTFAEPTIALTLVDDLTGIDFIAIE